MAEQHRRVRATERERSERQGEQREDVERRPRWAGDRGEDQVEDPRQDGDDPDRLTDRLPREERRDELRDDEHDHDDQHLGESGKGGGIEPRANHEVASRKHRQEDPGEGDRPGVDERGELQEARRRRLAPIDVPHEERATDRELDHEHAEDERKCRERHQPSRSSERWAPPVRSIARWKYSLP